MKKNKIIVALLVVIIALLIAIIGFGGYKYMQIDKDYNKLNSDYKEIKEKIEKQEKQKDETVENAEKESIDSATSIYQAVLDEYKTALKNKKEHNGMYQYVNENGVDHYFEQRNSEFAFEFKYAFYDINGDGTLEMLISTYNDNNVKTVDIFSHNGSRIIRLLAKNANCLSEGRCTLKVYDNGIIYLWGSGGATSAHSIFYKISSDSTLETTHEYSIDYPDNGNIIIRNKAGEKVKYNSLESLESTIIGNAKEIVITNWLSIN